MWQETRTLRAFQVQGSLRPPPGENRPPCKPPHARDHRTARRPGWSCWASGGRPPGPASHANTAGPVRGAVSGACEGKAQGFLSWEEETPVLPYRVFPPWVSPSLSHTFPTPLVTERDAQALLGGTDCGAQKGGPGQVVDPPRGTLRGWAESFQCSPASPAQRVPGQTLGRASRPGGNASRCSDPLARAWASAESR